MNNANEVQGRRALALSAAYVNGTSRIPDVFNKIRDGQAPPQVTIQLLKDWGFSSSNDRAFVPLLKSLGFLTPNGEPTTRYHEYRDHSRSKAVMGQALREAYHDIFLITANPKTSDKAAIHGKFKSFHNVSDSVAELMTRTFFTLLPLADLDAPPAINGSANVSTAPPETSNMQMPPAIPLSSRSGPSLHYNIQIHLPATKDVEVYNAIFKSLKDHLVD